MKKLLITLFYADNLHGGVKYSAELGDYFYSLGYDVYCVGVQTSEFAKIYFEKNHVKLINIKNFDCAQYFDLVWAHHFPILPYLVRFGLKYKKLINSCISSILLIEKPIFSYNNTNLILTLTDKTRNVFIKEYGIPADKIKILPNTAPDIFFENPRITHNKLRNIAIVSNHKTPEIKLASKILRKHGIKITQYGGSHRIDITPDVLKNFDVIISIGKTVQYAMAMGIPIYNYDHFGGSGYITPENVDIEEASNFSGRSFYTKKTPQQIANEIISQYEKVCNQCKVLQQIAEVRYKQSIRIQEILKLIDTMPEQSQLTEIPDNKLLFDYCEFIIGNSIRHTEPKFKRFLRHLKTMKF